MRTRSKKPRGRGACPSHLCSSIRTARRGGSGGYDNVGAAMVAHVGGLSGDEHDEETWSEKLAQLENFFGEGHDDAILAWFDAEVPRIMVQIPSERRSNLLRGMYRGYREADDDTFAP